MENLDIAFNSHQAISVIMHAQQNIALFGQAQQHNSSRIDSSRPTVPRKEKKIFKYNDNHSSLNRKGLDWSKSEKICYARMLLTTIINSFSLGAIFFEALAQELNRKPREVYVFHRNMISEFRTKNFIVKEILGLKVTNLKKTQPTPVRSTSCPCKEQVQKLSNFSMVNTNSSDDMVVIDNEGGNGVLRLTDKAPDFMASTWDDEFQLEDYLDETEDDLLWGDNGLSSEMEDESTSYRSL